MFCMKNWLVLYHDLRLDNIPDGINFKSSTPSINQELLPLQGMLALTNPVQWVMYFKHEWFISVILGYFLPAYEIVPIGLLFLLSCSPAKVIV